MTLDKLMTRFSDGDISAFGDIYAQTQKTVYFIALSIVKEKALAEDVMQSAYLSVIKNAAKYRAGTNAAAWIAKIAKNEALALAKKRGREIYVDERENLDVFGTEQTNDFGLLTDAAKKALPEDEFLILMLAAAEGYKRREIAEILDMPLPTVTWKYKRATEKMREIFRDGFGED
ncbi:MAG: sigma-70 family RNA polymerase sigma factor [Clostridia bacterium]|nr:sigma-70 family RNA polymerase sigma factor [Clostridia bacterium]